jgi:hypothetical protein
MTTEYLRVWGKFRTHVVDNWLVQDQLDSLIRLLGDTGSYGTYSMPGNS